MDAADVSNLKEYQKCVAVIMDIGEGLVYKKLKHSGVLLGFTDLGNINVLLESACHQELI